MSAKRFAEEFRIEAAKQVMNRRHPGAELASRLGVSSRSLYQCIRHYQVPKANRLVIEGQDDELS
jgi:transposase